MTTNEAPELFERAIRDNQDDLLRYFQRRLLLGADAAEGFAELLLTAWKQRGQLPTDPLEARMWLYGIARNVLHNVRRANSRRSQATHRLVRDMTGNDAVLPFDEVSIEVRAAIESLPEDDGELVRLIYWDGLKSHEAAVVLGINPSTARSRLAAARHQLKLALSPTDSVSRPTPPRPAGEERAARPT